MEKDTRADQGGPWIPLPPWPVAQMLWRLERLRLNLASIQLMSFLAPLEVSRLDQTKKLLHVFG